MDKLIPVMIVDDEKLILEDLMTIIDWEDMGFEIVTTAFNGKQALRKYQQYRPEIIFTDIKMPFMDGIKMLAELRKIDAQVPVVLLTAYEDFEYAKAAIRYGVTEYIIKSEINVSSLKELLIKLQSKIKHQKEARLIFNNKILEKFFTSSKEKNLEEDSIFHKLRHILLIEQDLPLNLSGEQLPQALYAPRREVIDMINNLVCEEMAVVAVSSLPDNKIIIVLDTKMTSELQIISLLHIFVGNVRKMLSRWKPYSFTIYLLRNRINLYDFRDFYEKNHQMFLEKYAIGSGGTILLPLLQNERQKDVEFDKRYVEKLFDTGKPEVFATYIKKAYESARENSDIKKIQTMSWNLYVLLKRESEYLPENVLDLSLLQNWCDWLDAEKICHWFVRKFNELFETAANSRKAQYSRTVASAIDYVYQNYTNPNLSVNDIADHVRLSSGYLSGVFKQEVGVTIKDYITDVRIEAAKKLIETGHYKIYELCESVGYQSSQYFSQVFLKKTGMLPTKYRKKE